MNKKGFTLTEILIVLVVAGILLALILPNTLKAIERGDVVNLRSDLNTLNVALFTCRTENNDWAACDTTSELVAGGFVSNQFFTQKHPFSTTYNVKADPSTPPTGGFVGCYGAVDGIPADVSADISLIPC